MKKRVMALVLSLAMLASNCTVALAGEEFTDTVGTAASAAGNLSAEDSIAEDEATENLSEENSAVEKQDSASDIFTDEGQSIESETEKAAEYETAGTQENETVITPDETSGPEDELNGENSVSESEESDLTLDSEENSASDNAEITPDDEKIIIDAADDDLVDAAGETLTSGDYEYTLDDSGNATITKYTGSDTAVNVPSALDGHTVVKIGVDRTVFARDKLQSVSIPSCVKELGYRAFCECWALTDVQLAIGIETIGMEAFYKCTGLSDISIPSTVKTIGIEAFWGCSFLKNIKLSDGLQIIESNAFYNCTGLSDVTIPSTVKTVEGGAFWGCTSLKNIKLSDGLQEIGNYAFGGCTSLKSLTIPDSVTYLGYNIISGTSIESITIPGNCSIPGWHNSTGDSDGVLGNCESLKTVILEDGITEIGHSFCVNDTSLETIVIPETVENIGWFAFKNCKNLQKIVLPNSLKEIQYSAFDGCSALDKVTFNSFDGKEVDKADLNLPRTVTWIMGDAFINCPKLKSVYYDAYEARWNNSHIDKNAFKSMEKSFNDYACGDKADWSVGDYCIEISGTGRMWNFTDSGATEASSDYCLEAPWCKELTYVYTVNNESKEQSFSSPSVVYINEGIEQVGTFAFANLENLSSVYFANSVQSIGNGVVKGSSKTANFYFLSELETPADKETVQYSDYLCIDKNHQVILSRDKTVIYACAPANEQTFYTIPETVTEIKAYAFYDADTLTQVIFQGNAPANMGAGVFNKCGSNGTLYIHYRDDKSGFGSMNWKNCMLIQDYLAIGRDTDTWGNTPEAFFNSSSKDENGYELGNDYIKKLEEENGGKFLFFHNNSNLWKDIDEKMNGKWTGACEGILSAMLAKYYGYLDNSKYGQTVSCFSEFNKPYKNTTLRELIHYYHLCQYTKKGQDNRESTKEDAANRVSYEQIYADILEEAERCSRTKEGFWFKYDYTDEDGPNGHLLLVCDYRKLDNNRVLLVLYDVNHTEYYEHWIISLDNPTQSFGELLADKLEKETQGGRLTGVLYSSAAQIKERLKTADPDYDGGKAQDTTKNYIGLKTNLTNVTITDESGHSSVYSNGTMTGNLPVRSTKNYNTNYVGANMGSSDVVETAGSGSDDASCFTEIELDPGAGYTITGAISGAVAVSLTGTVYECDSSAISTISVNKQKGMTIYGSGTYTVTATDVDRYCNKDEYAYSVTFTSVGDVTAYYDGSRIKLTGTGDISNAAFKAITLDGEKTIQTSSGDITVTHIHNWKESITKKASCTTAGEKTSTCTTCGLSKKETIPATGQHSYGAWKTISAATLTAAAEQERTCSVCGAKETRSYGTALKSSIRLNFVRISLKVNQSTTKVKVASMASGDSVSSWKSLNTKVATVTKAGKITGKKVGTTKIKVTSKSGASTYVTVIVQKAAVSCTSVKLNSTKVTLNVGKTYQLKTTVNPVTCVQKVTYKSSNTKVASVSSTGKITAKKKGTAVITVKAGTKTAKCKVTVTASKAALKLSKDNVTLRKGDSRTIFATVTGTAAKVTWKSSNTSVAVVESTGTIRAKKKGTAVITATAGGQTAKCKVTVTTTKYLLELSKNSLTLKNGGYYYFSWSITGAPKVTAVWKSSNPSVVSVTTGAVYAHKAGTATITATAGDATDKCVVTVK